MLLPVSASVKGILWFILFGLAKTFQYSGLTILGAEGIKMLREKLRSIGERQKCLSEKEGD